MNSEATMADMVREAIQHSLFRGGEDTTAPIVGDGIVRQFGFHPGRIEERRAVVVELISRLDPAFLSSGGGGMSFLNLCVDKDGNHWAEHQTCGELCALATALKLASFPMPRFMWPTLPGSMPYVTFFDGKDGA